MTSKHNQLSTNAGTLQASPHCRYHSHHRWCAPHTWRPEYAHDTTMVSENHQNETSAAYLGYSAWNSKHMQWCSGGNILILQVHVHPNQGVCVHRKFQTVIPSSIMGCQNQCQKHMKLLPHVLSTVNHLTYRIHCTTTFARAYSVFLRCTYRVQTSRRRHWMLPETVLAISMNHTTPSCSVNVLLQSTQKITLASNRPPNRAHKKSRQ